MPHPFHRSCITLTLQLQRRSEAQPQPGNAIMKSPISVGLRKAERIALVIHAIGWVFVVEGASGVLGYERCFRFVFSFSFLYLFISCWSIYLVLFFAIVGLMQMIDSKWSSHVKRVLWLDGWVGPFGLVWYEWMNKWFFRRMSLYLLLAIRIF